MGQAKSRGQKRIPLRTCVACRTTEAKRALIRLVRLPDGDVVVDPTGKRSGRGAYLCPQRQCWQKALKTGSLGRALKTTLRPETLAALQAYAQQLPETLDSEPTAQIEEVEA